MEVTVARSFIKDLKSAPKPVQQAADAAIKALVEAKNLQSSGLDYTKMEGQKKGENYYRIRIGDWRVVYIIDDAARLVSVTRIAHRSEVYD